MTERVDPNVGPCKSHLVGTILGADTSKLCALRHGHAGLHEASDGAAWGTAEPVAGAVWGKGYAGQVTPMPDPYAKQSSTAEALLRQVQHQTQRVADLTRELRQRELHHFETEQKLAAVAAAFADHPDYRDEWKP